MTENVDSAKGFCDKIDRIVQGIEILFLNHPIAFIFWLCVLVLLVTKGPGIVDVWNYHGFYPFRYDYSSICIGGGCP
jgi:hypothetical protein